MERNSIQAFESRVIYLEHLFEIQQVMHRYLHYFSLLEGDKMTNLFSQKANDISIEVGDSGVFEGKEGIERFHKPFNAMANQVGVYIEHTVASPMIEVARDGATAKVVWFSPGHISSGKNNLQCWSWWKIGGEFIKEEEIWKIWHLHFYQTFECRVEKGWLYEQEVPLLGTRRIPPWYPPDQPTTYHMPYAPHKRNYFIPEPPKPY